MIEIKRRMELSVHHAWNEKKNGQYRSIAYPLRENLLQR
jgi:hypothetical protein